VYWEKASTRKCLHCGEQASEWAYDHQDPDERISARGAFSDKKEHYIPLCVSCHRKFDSRGKCRAGHPFTEESTYWYRGYRLCRVCRKERARELRERRALRG